MLQAVYEGSLSDQEAEYQEHETTRDYLWNTAGTAVWGMVFPVLSIVATQLAGAEGAGMFAMAFVTGTLLMIAAGYGVRTHQVSDLDEDASFASYQVNRWLTGIAAFVIGLLYCTLRDYDAAMMAISLGVYVYKVVDGVADVYEGRLSRRTSSISPASARRSDRDSRSSLSRCCSWSRATWAWRASPWPW